MKLSNDVSEDMQIKFGMVICKSVGLAQGQLREFQNFMSFTQGEEYTY